MTLALPSRRAALMPGQWVGNALWRSAKAVPSLDLRFADSKSLVDSRTGQSLVTFTRASSATYIDSAGTLRTAVTNLLLRSEEFDNASWTKTRSSITADSEIAPNGTLTADKVVEDTTASATHLVLLGSGIIAGNTYTYSVYAKSAGRNWIVLSPGGNWGFAWFNISSGTIGTVTSGGSSATAAIQPVGNGWYRCSVTSTAVDNRGLQILVTTGNDVVTYTGDGTSGVFLWGAQLEQSSTVGEYIPTTGTINSAPRFDHNPTTGESLGLLVEDQRTNSIRNNTMVGAVAGTPGTSPTNWNLPSLSGLTQTIVGTGTESGIAYIDIRIFGTTSSVLFFGIRPEGLTVVAATPNSIWTSTFYVRLVGGSLTNVTAVKNVLTNFNSSGAALNQYAVASLTPTSAALATQRYSVSTTSATFADATTAFISGGLQVEANSGAAIDITLRIGLPQLELGAFATSVILTDNTAPLGKTRNADVANITGANFSSWYRQDEGTMFADVLRSYSGNFSAFPKIFSFNDGTTNNLSSMYGVSGGQFVTNFSIQSGGVGQTDYVQVFTNVPGPNRIAQALAVNSSTLAANGALTLQDSSVAMPVGINRVSIGADHVSLAQWGGHIRRLTFFPQRLPNSTLQAITR